MHKYLLFALFPLVTGCLFVPDLPLPSSPVARSYAGGGGTEAQSAAQLPWQQVFADPQLQALVRLSLENNRDLRIALLNVETVRAQYNIQRSSQLPGIDGNASYSRQQTADGSEPGALTEQYSAGVVLTSFEIDLFGRLRSLSQGAFERYLATREGALAARTSLIGAVADAYLTERLAEEQLKLTESTLSNWKASHEIAIKLKEAMQNSQLDVEEAAGLVYHAQADLEGRIRSLAQAKNNLTLLVGSSIPADLPPASPFMNMAVITQLPAGLPSDLLTQRADIRQAEHELMASNADIGAARAAFFPRLSLTAAFGFASPALGELFSGGHQAWSFSPQIMQPIFPWGRLRGERDLAKIRKDIRVQEYEKAIQVAFREVSDGLAGRATYARQVESKQAAVNSAVRRLALTKLRHESGIDSRLELLDSQRSLYIAEQTLLDLKREEYSSAAGLYRALGGGE